MTEKPVPYDTYAIFVGSSISALWVPQEVTASTYLIAKPMEQTTANPGRLDIVATAETTGEAVLEIRRRAGLTWEELADLFNVSRRSVHHWANGKPVTAEHDRQIRRILAVFRKLDQGEAKHTRALLLSPRADGRIVLDIVKEGASVTARRGLRPPTPAELVGALSDRPDSSASTYSRVVRLWRATEVAS